MSNYSINCTSIEEIDETSTEYIITQVFGWATGILALVKVFFLTITILIKKYTKNKTRKTFLFNPENPDKSFDVYIDKNPKDTIPIKYTTISDVENTIRTLEHLYKMKRYSHKRIWQVGMIMYVRLKVLKNKKPNEYKLAKKYFLFLKNRTKVKDESQRKKLIFKNFNK